MPTSSRKSPPAVSPGEPGFSAAGNVFAPGEKRVTSPVQPPPLAFCTSAGPWHLSPEGLLLAPDGQPLQVLEARVTRFLAHLRVRAAGGGRRRSLLFHALNTPEPGFRRLRARLRWALPGNLPPALLSQPLTHGASGEDHGGLGLANSRDR